MVRGVTSLKRLKQKLEEGRKEAWESGKNTQAGGTTKFKGERLPAWWGEGKEIWAEQGGRGQAEWGSHLSLES